MYWSKNVAPSSHKYLIFSDFQEKFTGWTLSIYVQLYTPGIHTEYICVIAEDREKIDRYVNIDRNPGRK